MRHHRTILVLAAMISVAGSAYSEEHPWRDPIVFSAVTTSGYSASDPFSGPQPDRLLDDRFGGHIGGTLDLSAHRELGAYIQWQMGSSLHHRVMGGQFLFGSKAWSPNVYFFIGARGMRIQQEHREMDGPLSITTRRQTELMLISSGLDVGRINHLHLRAEVMMGWFERISSDVISDSSFTGSEPLSYDALPLVGWRLGIHRIPLTRRLTLTTELQYLTIMQRTGRINIPTPETPFHEWRIFGSGSYALTRHLRVFGSATRTSDTIGFAPERIVTCGISLGL